VIRHFIVHAPNITITHVPMNAETISNFDAGEFDAMISPLGPLLHQHHPYEALFLEQWICVAREGNTSVGESITVDAYYAAPHVSPSYKHYIIDRSWQPPLNTAVRTAARLPFSAIPILVSETDFIAVLPERLVKKYEALLHLRRIVPIPPPPPVQFVAHWHAERSMDPFLVWTLEQLAELGTHLV
jgi:DNA-binding transcriptional LysR family regulator